MIDRMMATNQSPYRAGVPEAQGVGPVTVGAPWRIYDRRTGAFLGRVARDCPTQERARQRGSILFGIPLDDVGAVQGERV